MEPTGTVNITIDCTGYNSILLNLFHFGLRAKNWMDKGGPSMKWLNALRKWIRANENCRAPKEAGAWPPRQLAVVHELIRSRRNRANQAKRRLQADDVESAVDEDVLACHAA